jgi:Cys-tRNA(Pro) deacylase
MANQRFPTTQAIRLLKQLKIPFEPRIYDFTPKGGTGHAAVSLKVPEHAVVKTLVMADEAGNVLLVLMHGDSQVSTKKLARFINTKRIEPCDANTAFKATGYKVGGISPLGTRQALKVYAEASLFELDKIFINGGKRGLLVEMAPKDLDKALAVTRVNVAV